MKDPHEARVVRADNFICLAEGLLIAPAQPRKMPVERPVEIFAVALAQRQPDAEADNARDMRLDAGLQNAAQILLGIVDPREQGREPDNRWDAVFMQNAQNLCTARRRADMRLNDFAQ